MVASWTLVGVMVAEMLENRMPLVLSRSRRTSYTRTDAFPGSPIQALVQDQEQSTSSAADMCLLIPPKPRRVPKVKEQSRKAPMRPLPRYSHIPARACCAPASSTMHHADDFVDYLQQQYPDEYGVSHQYTTQIGLYRLDDTLHAHADQNQKATETVGEGVKDIQDRLNKMEETLKDTEEAASATWDFCNDDRRRRDQKLEDKAKHKDEALKMELERLKGCMEKDNQENEKEKRGLGEAEVRKLLEEREMELELEALRQREKAKDQKLDSFVSEAQLQQILDQREQTKELQSLQAQQKARPEDAWLERLDLVKILDQRERERELFRLQKLENDPSKHDIKQEKQIRQEQMFRRILEDHEQRRDIERLRSAEAEAFKHKPSKPDERAPADPLEFERLVEGILARHFRNQNRERSRGKRVQSAIDEILSLLLQRQSVDHAADVLEDLIRQTKSTTSRPDNQESDRQWILAEVQRYLDTLPMDGSREHDNHKPHLQYHSDGTCRYGCGTTHSSVHSHAYKSPPPSYRDTAGSRRSAPERPNVRFSPFDQGHRQK